MLVRVTLKLGTGKWVHVQMGSAMSDVSLIESLEAYLFEVPRTIRRIHCILDNGSSHIAKATQAWVATSETRSARIRCDAAWRPEEHP